jgi:aconitate hydratase
VQRAQEAHKLEEQRRDGKAAPELESLLARIQKISGCTGVTLSGLGIGSAIFARKPGDGSAREQAASCQRVLGGSANFALEYATKRYRSNLINWGILPFVISNEKALGINAWVFFPALKKAVREKTAYLSGYVLGEQIREFSASLGELTDTERKILADGCLINYYRE